MESFDRLIPFADVREPPADVMVLAFDARTRSRGKGVTETGEEIAWFLERGIYLRDGDCLQGPTGRLVKVSAAPEPVSRAKTKDTYLLTRAAYHLGNRHVPLQIDAAGLSYQPDHVLDDMIRSLGLTVDLEDLPFQPEDGAYHSGHHHHDD